MLLRNFNLHKSRLIFKEISFTACFSSNVIKAQLPKTTFSQKCIGQPTCFSHPHLIKPEEVTPMIKKQEYEERRHNLITKISEFTSQQDVNPKNHMVILPSASKKYMSDKIPYIFRQNTEFLYLTGCQEPDSCLILLSNSPDKYTSILFVQGRNAHSELWDGPRICPTMVNDYFGIDQGLPMNELESYLELYLKSNTGVKLWYDILTPVQMNTHHIMHSVMKSHRNNMLESPKIFIDQLRIIKSPAEIELMKKSCKVASEAIIAAISTSYPGINEHEIFAKVDYECRIKGAEHLAYPPVVAGGKRANIIHYINNNQTVKDGEIVLMDAGCELHGYSSDITRTWPIGGKFNKQQKELYGIVLQTQLEVIDLCKKFPTLDSLFDSMCKILGKKLQEIGIIHKSLSNDALIKAAYNFCPHHVSHYLGMDVHDTPSVARNIPIRPGMIVTVEPGVYIHENNESVPKEYRGIGIRIEDDVLITKDGPEVLSEHCPKEVDIIEKISSS